MPDPERKTVSATQVPALFDASPWTTRWLVYQHLRGNELPDVSDSRMDWGKRMEPLLLEAAADDLGLRFERAQRYRRRGPVGATLDADWTSPGEGGVALETKCVFDYRSWMQNWDGGNRVPIYYELQLQTQMLVGDGEYSFKRGYIAAWVCGEMKYFERRPDLVLWNEIECRAADLLDAIDRNHEPDPLGVPVEVPLLKTLYPEPEHPEVDLRGELGDIDLAEAARSYRWHAKQRKSHADAEKSFKAQVIAACKKHSAEVLRLPHTGVRLRANSRGALSLNVWDDGEDLPPSEEMIFG